MEIVFFDTNIFYATILENDAHHELATKTIAALLQKNIPIIIPEAVYRELRQSFYRKYLNAQNRIVYHYRKAIRQGLKNPQEIFEYIQQKTLEYASQHDRKSLNMYQYLLEYIQKNQLLSKEKRPLFSKLLSDHLIGLMSRLQPVEDRAIHLNLREEELEIYRDIYDKVGHLFKDEPDAEIFCQIASSIATEEEDMNFVLYTTDKEFSKTGTKAIDILNQEGYNINLEIRYLPEHPIED